MPVQPPDRVTGVAWHTVGTEGARLALADAAHPDPDALCASAALAAFAPSAGDLYPGVRAAAPPGYREWLEAFLADAMGLPEPRVLAHGFAVASADPAQLAPVQRIPHFDTSDAQVMALVHYLSPDTHGGTRFYRHRASGFERITPERAGQWRNLLREDAACHGMPPQHYIGDDTASFTAIGEAPWLFNRIAFYPASLLHAGQIGESWRVSDPARRRLTITALVRIALV